jgi:hypothetical protein
MRSYLIDELFPPDLEKVRGYLRTQADPSGLEDVFWVRMPDDLLTSTQYSHDRCRPHVFAVELGPSWVKIEFFVRSTSNMRCTCPGYCPPVQRDFVIRFGERLIEQLGIQT